MRRPDRLRRRGVGAIVAVGVLAGVLQGTAGVAVADAKPGDPGSGSTNSNSHRGPNKATPQKTTGGSSARHTPNRGPNKTRPGDTAFNDDHPRIGAEPDRGAHKVRPGDTWSPTAPRDRSGQPKPPRRALPGPTQREEPGAVSPPSAPQRAAPQPVAPAPEPEAPVAPSPEPTAPQPAPPQAATARPTPQPTVDANSLKSVESPEGLPSTVGPTDPNGPIDRTVRYTPGPAQQGPGIGLPERREYSPPGNHTSSWGKDPGVGAYGTVFEVGDNRMQVPLGSEPDPNVKANRMRGVDVTAKVLTQVRISSATPTGQRQVRDSAGNTWTETTYRYGYQRRTMYNGGVNSLQVTAPGSWDDITPGEARRLFDRGIPRPRALGR
ncbi:hypothetical protein [Williamsia sp. M5A3_1d]